MDEEYDYITKTGLQVKMSMSDDYCIITAAVNGRTIGQVEIDEVDDDHGGEYIVCQVHVNGQYQRVGIASEMLRLAVEKIPALRFPVPTKRYEDDPYYYSCEGAALINSLIRKGVVSRLSLLDGHNFLVNQEDQE